MKKQIKMQRNFLKAEKWIKWDDLDRDQKKGVSAPPMTKDYPEDAELIDLIPYDQLKVGDSSLKKIMKQRKSRRKYSDQKLSLEELSFLLWSTQAVKENRNKRAVPSAGDRHPFETYLYINKVENLNKGIYRYLPVEHKLIFIYNEDDLNVKIAEACRKQKFIADSAVIFIWTAVPYRSEWRYDVLAHKMIALDAGHLCQNLYLASESVGAGTCAIGAYYQQQVDAFLDIDGEEEFVIYLASVGKIE
ncbi:MULTISPECIES: SagB/ThcOx family dehydrogenase [unclassified Halanaerobium]|uniref:SagB/ThcOx family dehydrogenase n=1 Tax=unclassified Halanaerobium TaxID=2641197 RepID=UPI000DF3ABA9|nr:MULTISPECIES: SagB/ThcOx family dehydrogenase [unclassified Halanaerobium]RCW40121.1 SagB-type dehydrogenase family enzyme [Halanaerobium sp. MA284_MarDTE_T2]RCW80753.1 SagB-type dehydrogenase family enzyme [Halanaerobium sp. DL-01]